MFGSTYPGVICVGAIDHKYHQAWFSNVLDKSAFDASTDKSQFYLAPGQAIKVASYAGGYQTTIASGTSFAVPHVAGIAATYISYMGLAAGGINKYLAINSLKDICESPYPDRPISQNRLVNTGLYNPQRADGAPFMGAPAKPVPLRK